MALQFLSNYHNVYTLTRTIHPIIHPSIFLDLLSEDGNQMNLRSLIQSAKEKLINYPDPRTGDTWYLVINFNILAISIKTLNISVYLSV